jgi:Co/Zn/Cd efflux system component
VEPLGRVVRIVAALNLAYFGIEFAVALAIGSVSLFADSVDFLEDASINFLIFAALSWTARNRARLGIALAGILFIPGLATLWTAWEKFNAPTPPQPFLLSVTGLGALAINFSCAYMLARYRDHGGSLTRAAFLSARNDALANVAIIIAGIVTAFLWYSAWPDLIVGVGIAALNVDAARAVSAQPEKNTRRHENWPETYWITSRRLLSIIYTSDDSGGNYLRLVPLALPC